MGFWSIASAASVSFGPAIGGYLVDYMDWNYIFYVNIPIGILALIVTAIVQREHAVSYTHLDVYKRQGKYWATALVYPL